MEAAEILTAHRDAIQFVRDPTLRGINSGLRPDELVEVVRLSPLVQNTGRLKTGAPRLS
jgi:alkyl sulfatase BDS1-like metallo-beta-lactamase superfamily hydrolase